MSSARLAVAALGAFLVTGISVGPGVSAPSRPRPRPSITPDRAAPVPAAPAPPIAAIAPAPPDVSVEVTPDAQGHRVVVRRPGHLVSLRHEGARAAGTDWAALHLAPRGDGAAPARDRLVWEATRPDTLETERGVVMLAAGGGELRAQLGVTARPEPRGAWKSERATCAAEDDGLGGFTVLCRFAKGVRHVGVANVTGARSLDDAWVMEGPRPVVRLDLPRRAGGVEGRVVGFTFGQTGVVLRAEASFLDGEAPALVIDEAARTQPAAPF